VDAGAVGGRLGDDRAELLVEDEDVDAPMIVATGIMPANK